MNSLADEKNNESIVAKWGGGVNSQQTYEEKYAKGYGVLYPEGHVIRFYERIIKYELGLQGGKILDFGCGNGTHAAYFMSKGFEVYGVDIIQEAITQASKIMGSKAKLITPNQSLKGVFFEQQGGMFDIVFANQSLYYLDKKHLSLCVQELYEMCTQGGICFFTMMSRKSGYAKCITQELDNGLSEVSLTGRLNETSYIHFVRDTSELATIFAPFTTLYIGEYDMFYLYEPYSVEGSGHHYIFIGRKE